MSVDNAILLTLITYLFTSNIGNTLGEECTWKKSSCSCVMPDGEGYDFSPMEKFISTWPVSNRTFYFRPCENKPLSTDDTTCLTDTKVSLCLRNAADGNSTNLGYFTESQLILNPVNMPQMVFKHNENGKNVSTVLIRLVCSTFPDKASQRLVELPTDSSTGFNYTLMLISPHVCRKAMNVGGLSTGSVLVIILFVFSGLYFGGGALALKLLRGATGWEMLPNQKFWFDFPVLVRDGIAFTFNGCKVVSYDQI